VNITWDDPDKLKAYIGRLQEAAQKLTMHNRRLRKAHSEIGDIVVRLAAHDLVKEESKWTDGLLAIRQRLATEEGYVAVKANMRTWLAHWDRQLYKVLELQFQRGVESLLSQIPTINVQLVYRDQRMRLRPRLEEVKYALYQGEMKRFLTIPQRFRGTRGGGMGQQQESVSGRYSSHHRPHRDYQHTPL